MSWLLGCAGDRVPFNAATKVLRFLAAALFLLVLPSGCMVGPVDGGRVQNRNSAIEPWGYMPNGGDKVVIEAFDNVAHTWKVVRRATSDDATSFTTVDNFDAHAWKASAFTLASAFWQAGPQGHFARIRASWEATTGPRRLGVMVANWDGCFDGGISFARLTSEGCFSWRGEAYVYTADYSATPPACPAPTGPLIHGHYMLDDAPACARQALYGMVAQAITQQVVLENHEIDFDNATKTESQSPVSSASLGGFLGGHRRHLERMQRRLSVFDYPWAPRGKLPAWDTGTDIPEPNPSADSDDWVQWGTSAKPPASTPGGSPPPPCPSENEHCRGWLWGPVADLSPNRAARPPELAPGAVCQYTTAAKLHARVKQWYDLTHGLTGGFFNTRDAAAYPLHYAWVTYMNDVYADWQACP